MGDCKDNMKTTSEKTETFLKKFKDKLKKKKKKKIKKAKTFVDLLSELSDAIDKLRIKKDVESSEAFVEILDEVSTKTDKLVTIKEKDLDIETNKFEENIQRLAILKEIRFHIDECVELATLFEEIEKNHNEILKQVNYHVEEAAELTLGYEMVV